MRITPRFSTPLVHAAFVALAASALPSNAWCAEGTPSPILITKARIFDGVADSLRGGNLLIEASTIKQISAERITPPPGAAVLDAGGRVLMPGLTDAHWHMAMAPNAMGNLQ